MNKGKSFLSTGRLAIRQPDGTFKDIGAINHDTLSDSIQPSNGLKAERWWADEAIDLDLSSSCEFSFTPENRLAFHELFDLWEKSEIDAMVCMIRKIGRKGNIECYNKDYKRLNRLVHKHFNMNFSRYCRSKGIRYFRGFLVLNKSGWKVRKK